MDDMNIHRDFIFLLIYWAEYLDLCWCIWCVNLAYTVYVAAVYSNCMRRIPCFLCV